MDRKSKTLCIGWFSMLMVVVASICVPFAFSQDSGEELGTEELTRLKLVKEAYLKMDKFYYQDIPKQNVSNLFYRNQFVMLSLLKNPADTYIKNLDKLTYSTINMLVNTLKEKTDTYSKFIHKDFLTRVVRENLVSRFSGIGIEVEKKEELFFIAKVYPKSSAEEELVMIGDELVAIEGETVKGWELKEIEKRLKIKNGEFVGLTLRHPDQTETFDVTLECRIIRLPSVKSKYYEENNIGYIQITGFKNETAKEFSAFFHELDNKDIAGLVIDLRNNGGGDETQVIELAGMFLPRKTLVVYFMKKDVGRREERTSRDPLDIEYPIVILTNPNTASSAEIFTGVMKHYEKAFVVGEKTKGHGSLKNTIGLSDGSALLLVTSRTFLPDDSTFDQIGLSPHIAVKGKNNQLDRAFAIIEGKETVEIK